MFIHSKSVRFMTLSSPTRNILLRQRCLRSLNALRSLLTECWMGLWSYKKKKTRKCVMTQGMLIMLVMKQYTHLTSIPCWTPLRRVNPVFFLSGDRTPEPTDPQYCVHNMRSANHADERNGPTNSRLRCEAPRKNKYGYQRSRVSLEFAVCLQLSYFGARRV